MTPLRWSWSRLTHSARLMPIHYSTKAKRAEHADKLARYGDEFPEKLLNKKHKIPPHMYVANTEIAEEISKCINPHLKNSNCDTVLELNPGVGHFTRKLLDRESKFRKIILIESMEQFMPRLNDLHSLYPERVKVQHGDFVSLSKLSYMDKLDSGTRVSELLHDVPQHAYTDEPNMLVFGAVGSYNFFKHLINSLIFQISLYNLGRCEMILAVPPPIYTHLTCSRDIGYLIYRSSTVLFQILFEYQFIAKLPREHFLPTQAEYNVTKGSKLGKVKSINPEYLYLVKFMPRRNLHQLCPVDELPALWFFIKQNFVSRRNRVIPNLEKWAPGCGPRLFINRHSNDPISQLYPDESPKKLPPYSMPCMNIHKHDYFPNINIYTQFGDLRPSQVLTLFSQFRSWPEYAESSFLASLENTLLKLETASDEQSIADDGINMVEEDDINSETIEEEILEKPKKNRRKAKTVV